MPPRRQPTYECPYEDCQKTFASKGSARTHILHKHVTPRVRKCIGCRKTFSTIPNAKAHCRTCNKCYYNEEAHRPGVVNLAIYESEHLRKCYWTPNRFVKDLLLYCRSGQDAIPTASYDWKIRTLLDHPHLLTPVRDVSIELLNHPDRWRALTWDLGQAKEWSKKLESTFSVDLQDGSFNQCAGRWIRPLLRDLIFDGMEHAGITGDLPPQHRDAAEPSYQSTGPSSSERPQCHVAVPIQGLELEHHGRVTTDVDRTSLNTLYPTDARSPLEGRSQWRVCLPQHVSSSIVDLGMTAHMSGQAQGRSPGITSQEHDTTAQQPAFWSAPSNALVLHQQAGSFHPPQVLPPGQYYRAQDSCDP